MGGGHASGNGIPGCEVELVIIRTKGDIMQDVSLVKIGGKGLFIKEIEEALLRGDVDLAVHSMKDVPAELPEGLEIAVTPLAGGPPGRPDLAGRPQTGGDAPRGADRDLLASARASSSATGCRIWRSFRSGGTSTRGSGRSKRRGSTA